MKEKCDNCQIKEIGISDDGVYIGGYHGDRNSHKIHVCFPCYEAKEQEYLQNYDFIYSYKKGLRTGYIKTDYAPCYVEQKDRDSEVLKQKDCPHCSPWKFPNDKSCANCDKELGDTKYFGNDGKLLCSTECINIHNKSIQKTCSECQKAISKVQEKWTYTNHEGKKETFCSSECFVKSEKTSSNNPSQSSNNDEKIPTPLKVFFWIVGVLLAISLFGILFYKNRGKKKKI